MVKDLGRLERGFESMCHLNTTFQEGPLNGRKYNENIKAAKMDKKQTIFYKT